MYNFSLRLGNEPLKLRLASIRCIFQRCVALLLSMIICCFILEVFIDIVFTRLEKIALRFGAQFYRLIHTYLPSNDVLSVLIHSAGPSVELYQFYDAHCMNILIPKKFISQSSHKFCPRNGQMSDGYCKAPRIS